MGVAVGDALDHVADKFEVVGEEAVVHVLAEEVAKDAAEVFVPWRGEVAARVGEHADEVAEEADGTEGVDLPFHAFKGVEEPPAGAVLKATGDAVFIALIVADDGGEDVVVLGVEVVEDNLGEVAALFEGVEVEFQSGGMGDVVGGVAADVASELVEEAGVGVAQGSEVELFGPAFFGVELAEEQHDIAAEAGDVGLAEGVEVAGFAEDGGGFVVCGGFGVHGGEAVVGEASAIVMKEVVTLTDGGEEGLKIVTGLAGDVGKFVGPGVPGGGVFEFHAGVGPEGGIRFGGEAVNFGNRLMSFEGVGGIVGGADEADVGAGEEAAAAEVGGGELFVALVPDFGGIGFVEEFVDAEEAFQFEGGPVVEGVAQGVGDGFGPGGEFVFPGGVAGDVGFGDAVGAHGPPFVVVATKPQVADGFIRRVAGDFVDGEVGVVVVDGFVFGELMVKAAGGFGGEEEVVVDEHGEEGKGRNDQWSMTNVQGKSKG